MKKFLIFVVLVVSWSLSAVAIDRDTAFEVRDSVVRGAYIYVPDSLREDVLKVLNGRSKVVDDEAKLDPNELTVWNGDTVPMILRSRNLGRFDRGLTNYLYIPKGQWSFGVTVAYGEVGTRDMQLFSLLNDIDISAHIFNIKPYVKYFFRNNLAAGLRFGYTSLRGDIDSFKVDIDEDMNFNINDIMYRNESYTAALTFSQYVGIMRRGRIGVFNELELAFSSGNSDFARPFDGAIRKTHTTYMETAINFSPGLSVFVMKNVSFNVSFGVFGFYLKHEKQTEDGIPTGNRFASGANFRFNIFNINFGIAAHI